MHAPGEERDAEPVGRVARAPLLLLLALHCQGALPRAQHGVHAGENHVVDAALTALPEQRPRVGNHLRGAQVHAGGDVAAHPVAAAHVHRQDLLPLLRVPEQQRQLPWLHHLEARAEVLLHLLVRLDEGDRAGALVRRRVPEGRVVQGLRDAVAGALRVLDVLEGHQELVLLSLLLVGLARLLLLLPLRSQGGLVGALLRGRGAHASDGQHRGVADPALRREQAGLLVGGLRLAPGAPAARGDADPVVAGPPGLPPRSPLRADVGLEGLGVARHGRGRRHAGVDHEARGGVALALALAELVPQRGAEEGQHHLLVVVVPATLLLDGRVAVRVHLALEDVVQHRLGHHQ
mmetsp:Transcript_63776/g.197646  ORF Transcript_63776/g.197646 Transcript_63776/m.197646 type:complete len:348 (+) Transcript_63776:343-1386(+)